MEDAGWVARSEDLVGELAHLAHEVEPGLFCSDDAARLACLFTRAEHLCTVLKTIMAKRAAECAHWRREGHRSADAWFAQMTGVGLGTAHDQLEVAAQLETQPEIAEAWRDGRLSKEQTSEISKATQADPTAARRLVNRAGSTSLKSLKDECRRTVAARRRAEDEAARMRRIHHSRFCRTWIDDEGAGRLEAKLTPHALAVLRACLQPFNRREFDLARQQGRRERTEAYVADALVAMARAAGQLGPSEQSPGADVHRRLATYDSATHEASGIGPESVAPGSSDLADPIFGNCATQDFSGTETDLDENRPRAEEGAGVGPPTTVIAIVSHDALVRGQVEAGEVCIIDGVGPVSVATVRAMATDAFLAAVVSDGTDIRSVAHAGRQVTARQRTALIVRDPHCVVPGCTVRVGLEIDHVTPWAITKVTTLNQLARICHHHHFQKTYEGAKLCGPPGRWNWTPPKDRAESAENSSWGQSDDRD